MSLVTRAGDLVYTFRFLKLLVTQWEDTSAYKLGLIDGSGKRIKNKSISTSEEKAAYTTFHRLVFNIKKLIEKVPGGGAKIASYAAALFLLKEKYNISEKNIKKIIEDSGIDILEFMNENNQWFVLEDGLVSPGIYRLRNEKLTSESLDELVFAKDKIRIFENCYPIDDVLGIQIYEGEHVNTGKKIHFTIGEIYK